MPDLAAFVADWHPLLGDVVQKTAPEVLLRWSRVSVAGRMILGPRNNGMSDARILS